MKRWMSVLLVLCLCLEFPAHAVRAEQIQRTDEDLPRGYVYVLSEGVIYYCVQTEEESFTLFRMDVDGTGAEKIRTLEADSFAVFHDSLYFCDHTDGMGFLVRMRPDGTGKEVLYPFYSRETLILDGFVYCVAEDPYSMEERILKIPADAPGTAEGDDANFVDEGGVETLPVDRPYRLWAHGEWLYYTAYIDDTIGLYRIRGDGADMQTLYAPEGLNTLLNVLGFDGETVYFGSWGEYGSGFTASWTPKGGVTLLDLPQCFAYENGFFYYDRHSDPSLEEAGVFRCRADGADRQPVTTEDVNPVELCGDWLFARVGEGLNAQSVMLPKDGSAAPVTVPGFGAYDYEAHQPGSEPEIDWNQETFGEGSVRLRVVTYEQSVCYRLLSVQADGTTQEALLVHVGPYSSTDLCFEPGEYILKIAQGETWISDEEAFGPSGEYSATEAYRFEAGSYEIVTDVRGDFYQDNQQGFVE